MGHSISEIVRQLGFSRSTVSGVYQEYMDGGQKISHWRLRIWRQAHEAIDPACLVGTVQGHGGLIMDVLEQGVKGHPTASTNLTELRIALANIWQVIPVERFQKLVESTPRRVAAVFKARGSTTRY
ncbi:uncharacterized protein TNCV_3239431 [Trichonephila clavipes]|nr:uncharacterized protein TNCV_3239431 [Trichonephila clavipes]